ncbi:Crp/Fnr family transcriptional regulator [Schleiferia thermophila]|uniref:Crp/Fnr family transcriptional regulator n=1 Tax=Schleiferia thermophila TaxID=884107 RepID=UPI003EEBA12C
MTEIDIKNKFPEFETELIKEILQNAVIRDYMAGDYIIQTGQYFKHSMLIYEGVVKLYREGSDGNEFYLYHIKAGEPCALSMNCAIRQERSEVIAKAVTDSTLIFVSSSMVERWMLKYPGWNRFVLDSYRRRFEEMLETIDQISFRALDERLEFYLKRQREIFGSIEINISHQQIADELNSSRAVISRLLKKMEQRGWVELHRNQIVLKPEFK